MEIKQEIICTILPYGKRTIVDKKESFLFSIFISPRLSGAAKLGSFKSFFDFENDTSWTSRLKNSNFELSLNIKISDASNSKNVKISINKDNLDPILWQRLFKTNTKVKSYEFTDLKDRVKHDYPVSRINNYFQKKYANIASLSPNTLPLVQAEIDKIGDPIGRDATLESFIDDFDSLFNQKVIVQEISKVSFKSTFSSMPDSIDMPDFKDLDDTYIKNLRGKIKDKRSKLQIDFEDIADVNRHDDYTLKIRTVLKKDSKKKGIEASTGEFFIEDLGDTFQVYEYLNKSAVLDEIVKKERVLDPKKDYGFSENNLNFLTAHRFFDRKKSLSQDQGNKLLKKSPEKPEFDFHQIIALLGDYPIILKKLGFILDCSVPVSSFENIDKKGFLLRLSDIMSISPANSGDNTQIDLNVIRPQTKCFIEENRIWIYSKNDVSHLKKGLLDLDAAHYELTQIDPDGASLKMIHSTESIRRQIERKFLNTIADDKLAADENLTIEKVSGIAKGYNSGVLKNMNLKKKDIEKEQKSCMKKIRNEKLHQFSFDKNPIRISDRLSQYQNSLFHFNEDYSKISKKATNKWNIKTNNYQYEIEQTKPGSFNLYQVINKVALDTPKNAGLPSLQSAGISVIERERAFKLHEELIAVSNLNVKLNSINFKGSTDFSNSLVLYAEDLLRGYRPDIKIANEELPIWRSLCKRIGKITITKPGNTPPFFQQVIEPYIDEGYIKSASITSDEENNDFYIHQKLFNWNGWSMVTPRPGNTIVTKGSVTNNDFSEDVGPNAETIDGVRDFNLNAIFKPPDGSLPRLRFGYDYEVRVRAVDLAGNGLSLEESSDAYAKSITYFRFEPVATPTLYPRVSFSKGESVERMVIRSLNDEPEKNNIPSEDDNERHVVPPKTSQLMAETHGVYDELIKGKLFQDAYDLAKKESGRIIGDNEGEDFQKSDQIIIGRNSIELPYLPDILARGVVLQNVPGASVANLPEEIERVYDEELNIDAIKIPFYNKKKKEEEVWPNAKPFRIAINEMIDIIKWDSDNRVLFVPLLKAHLNKIKYSCYFDEEDLNLMGIWDWMKTTDLKLKKYALSGCHWMMTPYRELTLVHAVQKPLQSPKIYSIGSIKHLGETFAKIEAEFDIHSKSTGKITIHANWKDRVDSIEKDKWEDVPKSAIAFEMDITDGLGDKVSLKQDDCTTKNHEFGDTHYRLVHYKLKATSRFTDYFNSTEDNPLDFSRTGEEFTEVVVKNSARPDSPKVNYIIPTFTWVENENSKNKLIRTRKGGGLRIYLERPWFSSGDGELLGVVLPNGNPVDSLKPYITQWGMDPIHKSPLPKSRLSIDDFQATGDPQKYFVIKENLSIDELNDKEADVVEPSLQKAKLPYVIDKINKNIVDVAAYKPEYDTDKKLWYCDIQVNPDKIKSYFPFIQLALARFQPESVINAHLSRITQTDPIQLSNDRKLTVTIKSGNLLVNVKGYGPVYDPLKKTTGHGMEMSIEAKKSELEWIKVITKELDFTIDNYYCEWNGSIKSPKERDGKLKPSEYRLVVREYEKYKTDEKSKVDKYKGTRVVYVDTVSLGYNSDTREIILVG